MLIEEAAGLGKHRKRRRRAQLKLERTQENLDRALDIEREARTRLRPLKRQSEAAELHERLERQTLETRLELVRDLARARARGARGRRVAVAARAPQAPRSSSGSPRPCGAGARPSARWPSAASGAMRSARRVYEARSARRAPGAASRAGRGGGCSDSPAHRARRASSWAPRARAGDRATARRRTANRGQRRATARCGRPRGRARGASCGHRRRTGGRARARAGRRSSATPSAARAARGGRAGLAAARAARTEADARAQRERAGWPRPSRPRRPRAARPSASAPSSPPSTSSSAHTRASPTRATATPRGCSSEELRVADGYELALAAALGGRLDAAVVSGLDGANALLDRAGPTAAPRCWPIPTATTQARSATPARRRSRPRPGRAGWSSWSAARSGASRWPRGCSPTPGSWTAWRTRAGLRRDRDDAVRARVVRADPRGAPARRGWQRARARAAQRARPPDRRDRARPPRPRARRSPSATQPRPRSAAAEHARAGATGAVHARRATQLEAAEARAAPRG